MKKAILCLLLSVSFSAFAQSRDSLVRDSQRRAELQASAEEWARSQVLPQARMALESVNDFGVFVTEPRTALPPELGGPREMVEISLDIRFSGWAYDRGFSRGRFSHFPERGFAQCRVQQKLWAKINSQGRPTRLVPGQRAKALIACLSGDVERWNDRHPWEPQRPW